MAYRIFFGAEAVIGSGCEVHQRMNKWLRCEWNDRANPCKIDQMNHEPINQWMSELMNRWSNESMNQGTGDGPMNQGFNDTMHQAMHRWLSESIVSRWVNESAKQWKNEYWTDDESINQWHSQSMHQFTASMIRELVSRWTNESTKRCIIEPMIQWIRTWMIQWVDELTSQLKKKKWTCQSMNPWIRESMNSTNRWISESMTQRLDDESPNQWTLSLSRWISESMNQWINRGVGWSGVEWSGVEWGGAGRVLFICPYCRKFDF